MTIGETLQRAIRPSKTRSTAALWAKSLLNAVLFFAIFMLALPWLAHTLAPMPLAGAPDLRAWIAGALGLAGIAAWAACLDIFSRKGRGTPLPADAPSKLVSTGLFARMRNPIMTGELAVVWAEAIYVASLGILLYAAVLTAAAHAMVVYVEEPELRKRFGAAYEDYCRLVPRWVPRISKRSTRSSEAFERAGDDGSAP